MCSRLKQHEFREQFPLEITFLMNVGDPHQLTDMGGILALTVLGYNMTSKALKWDLKSKTKVHERLLYRGFFLRNAC